MEIAKAVTELLYIELVNISDCSVHTILLLTCHYLKNANFKVFHIIEC